VVDEVQEWSKKGRHIIRILIATEMNSDVAIEMKNKLRAQQSQLKTKHKFGLIEYFTVVYGHQAVKDLFGDVLYTQNKSGGGKKGNKKSAE
jgi:hypothetical protein